MTAEMTQACARDEAERVAVTNHHWRYRTYIHAAYSRGYDGCSKTLCGRSFYDPMSEARGADAWAVVDCKACKRAIAKGGKP